VTLAAEPHPAADAAPLRVAFVTAGAAGMYCGSCLHDNTLAARLIGLGHDVVLIPTYTPIRTDETDVSADRVFYGAVNVYLEQRSALFRVTPRLIDRLFNARWLLDWASRRGSTVDARVLADLTLSMLRGEEGRQRKELERLIEWLRELRPQLVHLTNSMFVGLARRIRAELGVPVVCAVQGEDLFLDELPEPSRSAVLAVLRERARDADGFVAPSRYYVDLMAGYLDVPAERIQHVPLGLSLAGFPDADPAPDGVPFTIGYLARICPEKGLHVLLDAFHELARSVGRAAVRLRVAGYLGPRDRPWAERLRRQVGAWGLEDRVDWVGEVDRTHKIDFLRSLHVLSVPATYREPKGLYVLEALAAGVPVVEPRHGAFPELLEATGGGVLFEPGSASALAAALAGLMRDPERRRALGRRGREAVRADYNDAVMAESMVRVYRGFLDRAVRHPLAAP